MARSWAPVAGQIAAEMERVVAENMKNANPFAAMGLDEEMIEQINSRKKER